MLTNDVKVNISFLEDTWGANTFPVCKITPKPSFSKYIDNSLFGFSNVFLE